MSTIIGGSSPSITFSDSTTQASAGLTAASPTIASGVLTFPDATTQSSGSGVAKAWVVYNSSAQTISASYNVSSVTYNSTGLFTVNFTNAFTDANYGVVATVSYSTTGTYNSAAGRVSGTYSTSACQIQTWNSNSGGTPAFTDFSKVTATFFR